MFKLVGTAAHPSHMHAVFLLFFFCFKDLVRTQQYYYSSIDNESRSTFFLTENFSGINKGINKDSDQEAEAIKYNQVSSLSLIIPYNSAKSTCMLPLLLANSTSNDLQKFFI